MILNIFRAVLFLSAGGLYIAGQYFRGKWFENIEALNICRYYTVDSQQFCYSPYLNTLGWPLVAAGTALAIVAVLMLFASLRTWKKWLIFSAIFVPIAVLIVVYQLPMNMPVSEISRESGTQFLGRVYIFATLLIVGIGTLRERRDRVAGK